MPQPQTRKYSLDSFTAPSSRPRAPLPFEIPDALSHISRFRNLNPYMKPKRSNSLQSSEIHINSRDPRIKTARSVSLTNDNDPLQREFISSVADSSRVSKANSQRHFPIPCKRGYQNPFMKQSHNTYPPYPSYPIYRDVPVRRNVQSMILDQHAHYRWDEDPCLLRPNSPDNPCPHNPRSQSHDGLDEGSCFVIGPSDAPNSLEEYSDFEQEQKEENEYSYAGEGILSPAEVIKAQARMSEELDGYGGSVESENIYEEIPDEWGTFKSKNRKSLVEEVFDEYERIKARRIHSATNPVMENTQTSGSIVTLDFVPHELSASPDSGLTVSAGDNYSDGCYDPVEFREEFSVVHRTKENKTSRSEKVKSCIVVGKPPLPKLVRCESMDIKDVNKSTKSFPKLRGRSGSFKCVTEVSKDKKENNLIRDSLRSSGRGLKLKIDEMKGKLEQSKKLILSKGKKGE